MICRLCPRECGVDRSAFRGFCGMGEAPRLARAALHQWEEPCISGDPDDSGQTGSPAFSGDMLKKGVIVRHLVLPYHYRDSVEVIKRVGERFGKHVLFSLMSQYTPFWKAKDIPRLNRRITTFEYRKALDAVYEAGLEGFMQERSSAREEYTPDFDLSGI